MLTMYSNIYITAINTDRNIYDSISNVDTVRYVCRKEGRFGQIIEIEARVKTAGPIFPNTLNANQSCYFR